jgi:hypothetical protein
MAATQLIHDATIVTADDVGSILYGAALAVREGRIAALGPTPEMLAKYPDAERVDGRGRAGSTRTSRPRTRRRSPVAWRPCRCRRSHPTRSA